MIILLLAACTNGDDTGVCASSELTISGTVYEDYSWDDLEIAPAAVAKVVVHQDEIDPITSLSAANGYYSLPLEPGHWSLEAFTYDESCVSMEDYEVDLYPCQSVTLDLLIETCFL